MSLGASLAELGYKVLVVDLDPQGNASTGLGIRHEEREVTVYDVLADEAPIEGAIVPTPIDNLFAIPSTIDLAGAEIELVSQFSRELRLKKAIEPLKQDAFDFVFLDCPPSLGLLTVNALAAAEELLVPIQCEYYALEGLGQLLRNVRLVQQNVNTGLRLTGIVMTMFDPRTKLSEQVVAEVRRYFGDRVYQTIIPRTVRLSEAPGFGQPITVYDSNSKGAQSYRALAQEVASRLPDESPLPNVDDVPSVVIPPPEAQPGKAPRPLVGPDDVPRPTPSPNRSCPKRHRRAPPRLHLRTNRRPNRSPLRRTRTRSRPLTLKATPTPTCPARFPVRSPRLGRPAPAGLDPNRMTRPSRRHRPPTRPPTPAVPRTLPRSRARPSTMGPRMRTRSSPT